MLRRNGDFESPPVEVLVTVSGAMTMKRLMEQVRPVPRMFRVTGTDWRGGAGERPAV